MWGYAAILAALAFAQSAGDMVADTKFDLLTAPRKFLAGSLHLWDPTAAFGQIQNQAYGYAWPMGPFFVVGELVHLPPWAIQRFWWTILLVVAFVGIVRLAQRLEIGTPTAQVLAGFAYVLTPRITTLLGGTSVEIWPMAVAPWVLLPLVAATERGSVRRAAAWSALAVASCGGVNAVAVAAVLPLGVIWIVTRAPGPRKWRLLGWWTLFTTLATLWWSAPLLLLGRYSVPFLDYIENATVTTVPTDVLRTMIGESDWVAYFAGIDFPAGQYLVTTPFLLLDAAAIAAFGLIGLALRGNPHQRFLTLGLVTGVVLVGLGYSGDLAGFFAADRSSALDGALAPLRNLHKFDVVLRIPLVLGLAHFVAVLPRLLEGPGSKAAIRIVQVTTVLALVALALPWAQDKIAPNGGVDEVPEYWTSVADYLESEDDGTVALEVPASAFGVYAWGNTHDDVMQGLAASPWAVRNVIPLAQPGNVVLLDAITRTLESGHPSSSLAPLLAANGVGRLVVRNDLDRFATGAPDPAYVHSVLDTSPGISLARSFGPRVGQPASSVAPEGDTRLVNDNGLSVVTGSVDVYDVAGAETASLLSDAAVLVGDPGAGLLPGVRRAGADLAVLAQDAGGTEGGQVLTDGTRRRETNFAAVRWNQSATLPAGGPYRLFGTENTHRFLDDQDRWQTTAGWDGAIAAVTASSAQAYADALPPLLIGAHPGAALDGNRLTAWESARQLPPTGQFWTAEFGAPTAVPSVTVSVAAQSVRVPELEIGWDGGVVQVPAPPPGRQRSYPLDLTGVSFLRIAAAGPKVAESGSFALSEVAIPGVNAQRYLTLPAPDGRFRVDTISLNRDPDRAACVLLGGSVACQDLLAAPGEDGDVLARRFGLVAAETYTLAGTVSLRRTSDGAGLLASGAGATSGVDVQRDVAQGPLALVDGDWGTTWVAADEKEEVTVRLPERRTLRQIRVRLKPAAAASAPTRLEISAGTRSRSIALDKTGRGELPGWRVRTFSLRVTETDPAFAVTGQSFVEQPAGISELRLNGQSLSANSERVQAFPCGSGPAVEVDGRTVQTRVFASSRDLMRGRSAPLQTCDLDTLALGVGPHQVLARPSDVFRVDSMSLVRPDAVPATSTSLDLRADDRGAPESVELPTRAGSTVLTLPQNLNAGWTATLGGRELTVQRVNGWMQGWRVPPGDAGSVRFSYAPSGTFVVALGAGAAGLLLVLLVVVVPARRGRAAVELPALSAGRPGLLDLVVVLGAGALLTGWWGLSGVALAVVAGLVLPRFAGWSPLAGVALLAAVLALSWTPVYDTTWATSWSQGWSTAALALCVAALAGLSRPRRPSRWPGAGGKRPARLLEP